MTELGERLKEARKRKGYTLEDLQEITKIQKRYLAGIENEEYDSMPGSFYIRAFIKQYAEAVDLNADEMLALYKGSSAKKEEVEEEPQMTLSRRQSRSTTRFNEVMPKIIVALFIIVIILVLSFLWRHAVSNKSDLPISSDNPVQVEGLPKSKDPVATQDEDEKDEKDEKDSDSTADDDESTDDDDSDEQDGNEQKIEHLENSGADSMYKLENSDTFKLEIRTTGPSWIGVTDEKQNELSSGARTMDAGEKLEVDASSVEQVRIRVGRTGETEIYVNGELLEYTSDAITQNIYIEYDQQ